jgi:hypothetical protein
MSVEFDKEAKQEYLDAIRFYAKAVEHFSDALTTCIQIIQESPILRRDTDYSVFNRRDIDILYS